MDIRLRQLKRIYGEMAEWAQDMRAVPRNIAAVQPGTRLAVVGEAIGPSTVRLSGVNYFDPRGKLGPTGNNLDRVLEHFGYTVYPPRDVEVTAGRIEFTRGGGRQTVYCTDLCPVFPGRRTERDGDIRRPSPDLIRSALKHRFLLRELEIVKPKVILLLGEHAYNSFYRYFLNIRIQEKLSALAFQMGQADFPTYNSSLIIPLLHPSPASPTFAQWFKSFPNSPHSRAFVNRVEPYLKS